jgi:hypothetical protein
MAGQMCWLPRVGQSETLVLHLRLAPHEPWMIYTAMPGVSVPDYDVPRGSKGWATYQHLFTKGWTLIPTEQARNMTPTYSFVK